jgi:thiol:disulfide interchange protein
VARQLIQDYRMNKWHVLLAAFALAGCSPGSPEAKSSAAPAAETKVDSTAPASAAASADKLSKLHILAKYDPARDPEADLTLALDKAKIAHKRVLLDVGGEWCSWCHLIDQYIGGHDDVREAFEASFVALKINYSDENKNEAFIAKYGQVPGYPHFFVLEPDGKLAVSQGTAELEEGRGYNHDRMLAFAKRWTPG